MDVWKETSGFWIFKRTYWVAKSRHFGVCMTGKTREEAMDKLHAWQCGADYG